MLTIVINTTALIFDVLPYNPYVGLQSARLQQPVKPTGRRPFRAGNAKLRI